MKELRPMTYKASYSEAIEKKLKAYLKDTIFIPLVKILKKQVIYNDRSSLNAAIKSGRIQYVDGVFRGTSSSRISKELRSIGAKYNKTLKGWTLPLGDVPMTTAQAIAEAYNKYVKLNDDLIAELDAAYDLIDQTTIDLTKDYFQTVGAMNKSMRPVTEIIGIAPELSIPAAVEIAEKYSNNMDLYIKGWAKEEILKLRGIVEKNAYAGYRADSLVDMIKHHAGVSDAKARFLAGQETRLLMSEFTQNRYKDIGIQKYRWSTSNDRRVRDRHKNLHGKIFSWDDPPVTDEKGSRNHPGQDFGCRCKAIPILD